MIIATGVCVYFSLPHLPHVGCTSPDLTDDLSDDLGVSGVFCGGTAMVLGVQC